MKNNQIRKAPLSKEEQFERLVDWAYRKTYNVEKENWITAINRAEKLAEIANKDVNKSEKLKIRWGVNELLKELR